LFQARRTIQKLLSSQSTAEPPRLVVNRVRTEHAPDSKDLERLFASPIEAYLPEDYPAVVEAHSEGRLVSPGSDLGRRLAQLAFRISGKPAPERRESRFSLFRQFRTRAVEL
jgi:Flp pilus assembly CpaE family ATPase